MSFPCASMDPLGDRSSHSLLTTAWKSLAASGAGSPSDNSPPEGLAERIAGDPTATSKPLDSFEGEVEPGWETPDDGCAPGPLEAGGGEAIPGEIPEAGPFGSTLREVVEAGLGWRATQS